MGRGHDEVSFGLEGERLALLSEPKCGIVQKVHLSELGGGDDISNAVWGIATLLSSLSGSLNSFHGCGM